MADQNPFASMLSPNVGRAGLFDMRMMSAANRMETPFERGLGRRTGGPRSPMLAGLMGSPSEQDYSSFTYDPGMRAQAEAMGINPLEASQVKNNVILPNTGFFGRHPRLSSALEGGIFGAAATRGSDTIGEGISNVAGGLLEGQQARQNLWRKQFEGPFQASNMLESFADRQQKRELQEADIQHLRALNEHLANGDDAKAQALTETNRHNEAIEALRNAQTNAAATAKQNQLEATAPRNLGGGLYGYYNPGGQGPKQAGEWSIQENPEAKMGRQSAGVLANTPNAIDTRTGRLIRMKPGDDARFIKPLNALEGDTKTADTRKENWINKHLDDPSTAYRLFANDPDIDKMMDDPDLLTNKLSKFYDTHLSKGAVDYMYDPNRGFLPTEPGTPAPPSPPVGRKPGGAGSMLESVR